MQQINPVRMEILMDAARQLKTAGHGERGAIVEATACSLNMSPAAVYRDLKKFSTSIKTRKRRSDSGKTALTHDEAVLIAGVWMETRRGNGKLLASLKTVVDSLRANGLIQADYIDEATGEVIPMSLSAISQGLLAHGLHHKSLQAQDPHLEMVSLHPNHVWQIDASLCVLYYLKPQKGTQNGLHVMAHDEFYKNKPRNLQKVMADRVWSYEITDHASGWIYVEYVMGAESGENFCNVLINAMQDRGGADILHGVPVILYMDMGSANTSAKAMNLCKALGIDAKAHAPGNARATGQVENARNIIERRFEFGLKFRQVADLDELNALAKQWRSTFNATETHSRHKQTRTAVWMKITAAQLTKAPAVELCRELAVEAPVSRVVSGNLRVSFRSCEWDLSHLPVQVGDSVLVTRNAWSDDRAQVILRDDEGHEVFHEVAKLIKDEFGFSVNAPTTQVFGAGHKALAKTPVQKAKETIEQVMTGSDSMESAEKARKAKAIPLGGQFDPFKTNADIEANLPTFMPRQGQQHELTATRRVEALPLTHVQAAMRLRQSMRDEWKPEHMQWLQANHPVGVPEDALERIEAQLRNPAPQDSQQTRQQPALRVVGG
jgi:hypothetical protein